MAYKKTTWKDHLVQKPMTYNVQDNDDGTKTLTPAFGEVLTQGTAQSAKNFNHMEDGIESIDNTLTQVQEDLETKVPNTRTINEKPLTEDIVLEPTDVGAAAATHKHAAGDITSGVLPVANGGTGANNAATARTNLQAMGLYPQQTDSGVDYNTLTTTGFYGIFANSKVSKNSPLGDVNSNFNLLVLAYNTQWVRQFAWSYWDNSIYTRAKTSNSWGAWVKVAPLTAGDVGASASSHNHALTALTGTLSVAKGGTGATDAATARTNLQAMGIFPNNSGSGIDYNNLTTNGFYQIQSDTPFSPNNPLGGSVGSHFHVLVLEHSSDWIRQIAFNIRTTDIYMRSKMNKNWSAWQKIAPLGTADVGITASQAKPGQLAAGKVHLVYE